MMLIEIINMVFQIYMLMIFARILSSWVPELQATKVMQFIGYYTDPYLDFFRKFIPPLGFLDISPMVAIFTLIVLNNIIASLLR